MKTFTYLPVTSHTDYVGHNSTFVAIKGMKSDGIDYIPQALARGASTIVCAIDAVITADVLAIIERHKARLVRVDNPRQALAELSAQAHGFPAKKLKIIGITGTKGKSTSTFLIAHALRTAGYRVAMTSTVHNRIHDTIYATHLTTAQPDYLQAFLALCVESKIDFVVMEIAAQALSLHRVVGILLTAALFTNFSQEHGEFYPTCDDYFAAKARIGRHLLAGAPFIVPAALASQLGPLVIAYSLDDIASPSSSMQGVSFMYRQVLYQCPALVGMFNIENLVGATLMLLELGIPSAVVNAAWRTFEGVPGRLAKYVLPRHVTVFIDYAHNPSSYTSVLSALRPYTDELVVVFGAGGERDQTKRPIMGSIAAAFADRLFITSDNPRSEDPVQIAQHIIGGVPELQRSKIVLDLDREQAIKRAVTTARSGAIILLLGKGPDEYQMVQGVKYPFSEHEIVQRLAIL